VNTFFRVGKTDDWKNNLSTKNKADIDEKTAVCWRGISRKQVYSTVNSKMSPSI
jgi:hypothetical protein